jgi:nicotinate phosphoribosyltransferase
MPEPGEPQLRFFPTGERESSTSPALLLDLYELTMAQAYWLEGMHEVSATFSLFARSLPETWGYLVAAGLEACLEWLERLRFTPADLAAIQSLGGFSDGFLDWLAAARFAGSVRAVREGTIVFPGEPILEVDGPLAMAQLAETYLLNQVTLQTGLATEASRCRHAAAGRPVVDFSLRRAPGIDAGMKLARCSRLVGLAGTSNVAGAAQYGLPASGTMAHSFVQAHIDETTAFRQFSAAFKERTLLLIDTYDTERGLERAIEVARESRAAGFELHGIRIDSGDLAQLSRRARQRLDEEGFPNLIVFVSGGLDEHRIDRLLHEDHAPIDGFGVGTTLGAAGGVPTLETVYKLVRHGGRPVRKTSAGKAIWPGAKQVFRPSDWSGDMLCLSSEPLPANGAEPLLEDAMVEGRRVGAGALTLAQCNDHFERQWLALPRSLKDLSRPSHHAVAVSPALRRLTEEVDLALAGAPG